MKRINQVLVIAILAFAACHSGEVEVQDDSTPATLKRNKEEKLAEIAALEKAVEEDQTVADLLSRQQLLVAYAEYVNFNNREDEVPEFLFRASKIAVEIGKPRRAVEYLINLHDGFPNYERRVEAVFMVAFIYENVLNDRGQAEKYYEQVVELYPESPWAEDARASMKLLYLTDEEKINMFMKQTQSQP